MGPFISDHHYKDQDFTKERLSRATFENCVFEGCSFSHALLDNQEFMECTFLECDLSNANITNTTFKEVVFEQCKMMGLRFETCNPFLMDFTFVGCVLEYSTFYAMDIKGILFDNYRLSNVDFSAAQLNGATFQACNLENAIFNDTELAKADFSTAYNYVIHPGKNHLKGALFAREGLPGLLAHLHLKYI